MAIELVDVPEDTPENTPHEGSTPMCLDEETMSTVPETQANSPADATQPAPTPPLPPKPPGKKPPKESSVVWDHFVKLEDCDPFEPKCRCIHCDRVYNCHPKRNGTSSMLAHINFNCPHIARHTPIELGQTTLGFKPSKSSDGNGNDLTVQKYSASKIRAALIEMVIVDELPFRFVEGQGFRSFMSVVESRFKVPSRVTVARDSLKLYLKMKRNLIDLLAQTNQRVCLTTDTWTSVQNLNYMCLTAHFVDVDWIMHKRILNFCLVANHKGETIGKMLESCLLDWGIDRIFTITVDNASSNDTAIEYVKRVAREWEGTILGGEFIHMRCCAHILNLIVNEGLKEMDDSILKVRNAVRYVKSSPNRLKKFQECVEKQKISCKTLLCLDVPTRWNSTYLMLEAAEKYQKAFQRLEEDDGQYLLYFEGRVEGSGRAQVGPPTYFDWDNVRIFVKFLKMFYDATVKFSGSLHVTSNAYFHELCLIKDEINELSCSVDNLLCDMAKGMKKKFDKYWGSFEKINIMLFVAVVLDPRYKLKFVRFQLREWYDDMEKADLFVANVRNTLIRMFDNYNSKFGSSKRSRSESSSCGQSTSPLTVHLEIELERKKARARKFKRHLAEEDGLDSKSEVDKYLIDACEDPESDSFDILSWWKTNGYKYPILSLVARDVLAIPVSTVASESAFSTGGRVLDPFRSSLAPATVEGLICAQNWLSSGPISLRAHMDEIQESYDILTDISTMEI